MSPLTQCKPSGITFLGQSSLAGSKEFRAIIGTFSRLAACALHTKFGLSYYVEPSKCYHSFGLTRSGMVRGTRHRQATGRASNLKFAVIPDTALRSS